MGYHSSKPVPALPVHSRIYKVHPDGRQSETEPSGRNTRVREALDRRQRANRGMGERPEEPGSE